MNILLLSLFFLFLTVGPVQAVPASVSFEPSTSNVKVNEIVELNINMYTGNEAVASSDIKINYDETLLEPIINQTKNGSIFQHVDAKIISPGTLYLYGIQEDKELMQPAQGTIATISFKALKEGNSQLSFECDPLQNTSSQIIKNNADFENIINCTSTLSHRAEISISKGSVLGTYSEYSALQPYTTIFGILVLVFTFFIFLKYQRLKKSIN